MNRKTIITGFIIVVIALTFSCKSSKNSKQTWNPPKDRFAFIEYYVTYDGKAIEGIPPQGMRIDGPTYTFDKELGVVRSYMDTNFIPDTVSVIMGIGRIRRGTEGGGLSSRLAGSSKLPISEGKLTVEKISNDMITFLFEDERINLKANDAWSKVYESTDTIASPKGNSIILRQITHQVSFHGILSKEKFNFPANNSANR